MAGTSAREILRLAGLSERFGDRNRRQKQRMPAQAGLRRGAPPGACADVVSLTASGRTPPAPKVSPTDGCGADTKNGASSGAPLPPGLLPGARREKATHPGRKTGQMMRALSVVMAGLVIASRVYPICDVQQCGTRAGPSSDAISLRRAQCVPKRDPRDTRAFTPVFDGLCPRVTKEKAWLFDGSRRIAARCSSPGGLFEN